MISVAEANRIVQESTKDFGIEEISLDDSLERVLLESIHADRDFPPYDRVTMDGIAIRYQEFSNGTTSFKIAGIAAAGAPQMKLDESESCLEVMTGSIMPKGVDTVIRYEDLTIENGMAKVEIETIRDQQNVHFKGEDLKQGDLIIPEGRRLSSSEIGVCATVGKSTIKVSKLPKAIIISTGDELVEIDQEPLPHQIRRSNVYRMKTILESYQMEVETDHIDDDYEIIVSRLAEHIEKYDVVLLSGGVSMGKFDFLPKAMEELGVKKLFHKIAQRPGKPFWFGRTESCTVFAFPGNPVSSFMCTIQYFKPWLDACIQAEELPQLKAALSEDVTFKRDLTYFLEVKLSYSETGQTIVTPVKGNGSGDLANLVNGDGFIELPADRDTFKKGEAFRFINYR